MSFKNKNMFNKLLNNLPFNPSLIDQVSFYAKRLKRESSFRRLGFIFIALAMVIQLIAVVSPPKQSLASSNNDLINGGIGSVSDAVYHCQNNTQGYGTIMAYYNISCANIGAAQTITLHSNDYNGQLFSMGRIPYSKAGETPVNISGTNYYLRYLWSWDTWGSWSTYTALKGTSGNGQTFFILFNCGNLVFIGLPPAPTPPPKPVCTTTEGTWYQGWGFWYRSPDGDVNKAIQPVATINPCVPPTKPACTVSSGVWYQGWGFWYQSPDGSVNKATKTVTTDPCVTAPPKKCPYDSSILETDAKCVPCPFNQNITTSNKSCRPCENAQTKEDKTACLSYGKKASNDTQGIADANNTTAKAGDTITYTLTVKNNGKADVDGFVIQENLSDVLDYADIMTLNGGTKDAGNIVKWPAKTIKAGQTVTEQFQVKVKDPIPGTPASSSDPGHFDLTMTNVYGNTVNIKLPATVSKTAEAVSTSLPNTGPGTTLTVGFVIVTIAGYFFARSRLLAKELTIVKTDYTAGEF